MASVVDIIVLDDDGDDEEGPSCSPEAEEGPSCSPEAEEGPSCSPEAEEGPSCSPEAEEGPSCSAEPEDGPSCSPEAKERPSCSEAKETPSCSPEAKESLSCSEEGPSEPPPMSKMQSNGKRDGGSSQNKISMGAENQQLFEEFVNYCSKLTVEHPEVISFLRKCFSKTSATYLSSVEFRNTLGRCLTRVQGKQTKLYVYINELCTVLKNHSEKKKVVLQTQAAAPQREQVETEDTKEEIETEDAKEEVPEKRAGSKHQIRRLENLLRLYSQEIQKLQERELTLEDMDDEDSTYIQESRLKQKMLCIFEKLCELKDCSSLTGRVIEQRIKYEGTRYKEVNRRLEKFINKARDIFPDYGDIFQVVQKASERHNLGLTRKQVQSIAQGAFRDLGNKLQHRRHLDMVYNFGSHLTDSYKSAHDPAEHDSSLARNLRENRSLAQNQLENVIKKYAEMQDEGEEDWKNRDSELPSTSKNVKGSPRSRKTQSHKSDESEEDEEEDEESEESDVDIEEELRQSQEAGDGEEDEEVPADYLNETDQKMEEVSDTQNSSPAGKEEGDDEDSDNSDQVGEEAVEEGTDKYEDQDFSSGSTSLSPEYEDLNTSLEMEEADPATPGHSEDSQLVKKTQEDHAEQEESSVPSSVTSDEVDSGNNTMEHLEMSVVEEDFVGSEENKAEIVNVPYVEAKLPSSKEQGTGKFTDAKNNLVKDAKSPTVRGKEGKFSRLDKCINKITGSLAHKITIKRENSPSVSKERFRHVNSEKPGSGCTSRTEEQSSNWKLVCVDTPAERWDSVRKVAFSHSQSADEISDVVHLDSCKNSTLSNASNGVHRAMVVPATSVNRLKRKRDMNTPTNSVVKVKEVGSNKRKRKTSSQLWTENGVAKYNGDKNGQPQKLKSAKLSSSYASYLNPSEPCSDNEHDITLDLMVTCSPQMTPAKTPSRRNKTDAATQCDPDEVIVLSD